MRIHEARHHEVSTVADFLGSRMAPAQLAERTGFLDDAAIDMKGAALDGPRLRTPPGDYKPTPYQLTAHSHHRRCSASKMREQAPSANKHTSRQARRTSPGAGIFMPDRPISKTGTSGC